MEGFVQSRDWEVCLETVLLSAEGVSVYRHVQQAEWLDAVVAGVGTGDDEAGAGGEYGLVGGDVVANLRGDSLRVEVSGDSRRLPAGHEEDVTLRNESGLAYLDDVGLVAVFGTGPTDGGGVFAHVALNGDDSGGQHRLSVGGRRTKGARSRSDCDEIQDDDEDAEEDAERDDCLGVDSDRVAVLGVEVADETGTGHQPATVLATAHTSHSW